MFKRERYQKGCVTREERKSGPDVWIFRWRELDINGRKVNRKAVIGTAEEYRTESAAQKAADSLRLNLNQKTPQAALRPVSVEQLATHYIAKELPEDNSKKAYSTGAVYRCYLKNWILPR